MQSEGSSLPDDESELQEIDLNSTPPQLVHSNSPSSEEEAEAKSEKKSLSFAKFARAVNEKIESMIPDTVAKTRKKQPNTAPATRECSEQTPSTLSVTSTSDEDSEPVAAPAHKSSTVTSVFVSLSDSLWSALDRFPPPDPKKISEIFQEKNLPSTTITRPPNLPKKSPEEEARHRKEFEAMLASYKRKKEKEEQQKLKKEAWKKNREDMIVSAASEWRKIMETWTPESRKNKRVRQLAWIGIPPSVRGSVWKLMVGNALLISPELFRVYTEHAKEAHCHSEEDANSTHKYATVKLIPLDLPRTFPALQFFQSDGPWMDSLREILEATVCYRPDIGYVQGMSYLAAMFLLCMDTYDSFQCLANVLGRQFLLDFFQMDMPAINVYLATHQQLMKFHLPQIYKHFKELGIKPEYYMIDWVLTLYSKSLPLDIASRVWDILFCEGVPIVFRAALGILATYSDILANEDFDCCLQLLTHLPEVDCSW